MKIFGKWPNLPIFWSWTHKNIIPDRQHSACFRKLQKMLNHSTLLVTTGAWTRTASQSQVDDNTANQSQIEEKQKRIKHFYHLQGLDLDPAISDSLVTIWLQIRLEK